MAESLDDGEFWLPPQFLADDDEADELFCNKEGRQMGFEIPTGFRSFGGSSDLGSPVESVGGSTGTESDEDDYLAGLTRRLARSTLEDDSAKARVRSGSPKSTLCPLGLNGWDLLYADADEVARMRITYGNGYYGLNCSNSNFRAPPRRPSPISDVGFHCDRSLSHLQFQAKQLEMLKRQQMVKQHQHNQMLRNRVRNNVRPLGLPASAWPSLQQAQQQPNHSGMGAVFLADNGKKRECAGTGVFLPRRNVAPPESRRKPASSTVLHPGKVVHDLNLNLEEMGVQPHYHPRYKTTSYFIENDGGLRYGGNSIPEKRHGIWGQQVMKQQEIRLPQEFTY